MSSSSSWPHEVAAAVEFLDKTRCTMRYEASLLQMVTTDGVVLDVVDPYDIIGVEMALKVKEKAKAAPVDNEPSSVLSDGQGHMVLTLHVYPRTVKSSSSWFSKKKNALTPNYTRPILQKPGETADEAIFNQDWQKVHGRRHYQPRHWTLAPAEDLGPATTLVQAIQTLIRGDSGVSTVVVAPPTRPLRYLLLVNPRSGPQRAGQSTAEKVVQPMLQQAGIVTTTCLTEYAGHARDRMKPNDDDDIAHYDGLVLLGGDGIIHEVLNGIMDRPDGAEILQAKVLGVVGCGTANGYASSIAHESYEYYGPLDETFLIAKGRHFRADLSKYTTLTDTPRTYWSFLSFTWSIIADVDIESERLYWLGDMRFDIWAVWRILFLRRYRGKLSYLPVDADTTPATLTDPSPLPTSTTEPLPSSWRTIDDQIVLLWVAHSTHAGMRTFHSPPSRLRDGVFQILLVRNVSRYQLTKIMLGLETGSHYQLPGVEYLTCTAFRLEPATAGSFNDIDGEPVENGPIQAHVVPGSVSFFGNPQR
jgi:sphingosine kinase